jgi:hypothetical protein
VTTDLVLRVKRRARRGLLLWLAPSLVGVLCFILDLRPWPHWAWDAGFLLLAIVPLCAALWLWTSLRADLTAGLTTIPCRVVRVDEPFPGYPRLEVQTQRGRFLLHDLREYRVVADYDAVYELTFARHLGWALALQPLPERRRKASDGPSFPSRVN